MSIERGGYIMELFSGGVIDRASKSIARCPRSVDAVRMKALGHLGVNFHEEYYGDTLSWRQFETIGIKQGIETQVKYPQLKPHWTYDYEAIGKTFTVTDDKGRQTIEKIETLADMGLVWDILSSHQFKIYFSADFVNDAFLIAWIKRRNQDVKPGDQVKDDAGIYPPMLLSYVDQFFNETLHHKCGRMVKKETVQPQLENRLTQALEELPEPAQILRSNIPVRSAKGDYTDKAVHSPNVKYAVPSKKRNAVIDLILGEFVMIAYFASINNMSSPVYEPWMLWGLWQWLGSGEPEETIEKIFDLSPRW